MRKPLFKNKALLLGVAFSLLAAGSATAQSISTQPTSVTIGEGAITGYILGTTKISITASNVSGKVAVYQWYKLVNTDSIPVVKYALTSALGQSLLFNSGEYIGTSVVVRPTTPTDQGKYFCKVRYAPTSYDPLNPVFTDSIVSDVIDVTVTNASKAPAPARFRSGASRFTYYPEGSLTRLVTTSLIKLQAFDSLSSGDLATSVRWFRNGVEIKSTSSGFTASDFLWNSAGPALQLTIANTPPSVDNVNGDEYYCLLKNSKTSTEIESVHIRLLVSLSTAIPKITKIASSVAPSDLTTVVYDTVFVGSKDYKLSYSATDYTSYQWKKEGKVLTGSGELYNPIAGWTLADSGTYTFVLTNGVGTPVESNPIKLTVIDPAVTKTAFIISDPKDITIAEGDTLKLTVVASVVKMYGVEAGAYKWYVNGKEVPGTYDGTLALPLTTISDTGSYYCRVRNEMDSAISATAKVTMTREPVPVFTNLKDVYDGVTNLVSPVMKLTLKGELSETLTIWQAVDSKGNIITLKSNSTAQRLGYQLIGDASNAALPAGKYTIRVSNADGTLVMEKAVEIK